MKKTTKTTKAPRARGKKITLVIPVRGDEPLTIKTMQSAHDTAGADIDIIAVYDGRDHEPEAESLCKEIVHTAKPIGTSRARHEGTIRAVTPLVVTCDAHMRFSNGWAKNIADLYADKAMANTVSCASMGSLTNEFTVGGPATYHGATFRLRDRNPDNNEHYALSGKWRGENKPGDEIGCIMGAFYAFRRTWYDAAGQPWAAGIGWGTDEETISLAAWLGGGRVVLMPDAIQVWHRMSQDRADKKPSYESTMEDIMRVWLNRFRLLHLAPIPVDLRAELLAWQSRSFIPMTVPDFERRVARDVARPEAQRIAAAMQARYWQPFFERWVDMTPPAAATATAKAAAAQPFTPAVTQRPPIQTINRTMEACHMCDALDPFRVRRTVENTQYLTCLKCGAHAVRVNRGPARPCIAAE